MVGYTVLFLAVIVNVALGCGFPNGTELALHWWPCGDVPLNFYSVTPLNENGEYTYPVSLIKRTLLSVDIDNRDHVFSEEYDLKLNIKAYEYTGIGGCKWSEINTGDVFKDLPLCSSGVVCPVPLGRQMQTVTIDFDRYAYITSHLKNDRPYQLEYSITNTATGRKACIMIQARAYTQ